MINSTTTKLTVVQLFRLNGIIVYSVMFKFMTKIKIDILIISFWPNVRQI